MADSKISALPSDAAPLASLDYFYVVKSQSNATFASKKISFSDLVEEIRKAVYTFEEDTVSINSRVSLLTASTDITSFTLENPPNEVFEKIIVNRSGNAVNVIYNDTQTIFVRNFASITLYYIGDKWTVTSSGGDSII